MFAWRPLPFIISILLGAPASAGMSDPLPPVKKTRSGVCLDLSTAHYARTRIFTRFESMDACLASGGHLGASDGRRLEQEVEKRDRQERIHARREAEERRAQGENP